MRTLGLVSLGAAVVSLSTIHFQGLAHHPDALSRVVQGIIQGIMAGIGFIGAGVILRDRETQTVKGLTTAATVWVTAALGIAYGLAAWAIVDLSVGLAVPAGRARLARRCHFGRRDERKEALRSPPDLDLASNFSS
jgi:putative Mg2+ transporter-C (MgtC) family protein